MSSSPFYRGVPGRTDEDSDDDSLEGELTQLAALRPSLLVVPGDTAARAETLEGVPSSVFTTDEVLESSEGSLSKIDFSELTKTIQQLLSLDAPSRSSQSAPPPPPPPPQLISMASARLSSSGRRSGLKTVHSGRSLSSHSHGSALSAPEHQGKITTASAVTSAGVSAGRPRSPRSAEKGEGGFLHRVKEMRAGKQSTVMVNPRQALFVTKLARRSHTMRTKDTNLNIGHSSSVGDEGSNELELEPKVIRRYQVGDTVLVCNLQSRWANLVNKYGFPPGEGDKPEERKGPYKYVLATVKKVHFEEIAAYYTVTRADTGADQRADASYMEPLRSGRGEAAALKAATSSAPSTVFGNEQLLGSDSEYEHGQGKFVECLQISFLAVLIPFFWLFDCFHYLWNNFIAPCCLSVSQYVRRQANLMLNGLEPYQCGIRLTCVNFVVVCSTWYMFIDQARLAFFPPSSDFAVAIINFVIWVVLALELVFETFIRPDGYRQLIKSEKAFAPTTVRYISAFHLIIESISLLIFIPEFLCLFDPGMACDDRIPFSFYNAAVLGVFGPTQLDVFYGHLFFALIRLRVLGLVRHWKNMWIANTFITMKWKGKQGGVLAATGPANSSRATMDRKLAYGKPVDAEQAEQKKREASLTNACNIGTALMVTNSYRALILLWIIVGVFPIIFSLLSTYTNPVAFQMTRQMQGTNLVASDTSNATCVYLLASVWEWAVGVTAADFVKRNDPFLFTLHIGPSRCPFMESDRLAKALCEALQASDTDRLSLADHSPVPPSLENLEHVCTYYRNISGDTISEMARSVGKRAGSILEYQESTLYNLTNVTDGITLPEDFSVVASFDGTYTIATTSFAALLLQICLLIMVLGGLSVLRWDAEVLVLGPLRRMLKRVARYAQNPLMPPKAIKRSSRRKVSGRRSNDPIDDSSTDLSSDEDDMYGDDISLGRYETEQLITAVNKITDLLRKCWGVAGADIISTNLATREGALTEVFNPTVPGKSVYALFGFASINEFDHVLRELQHDVLILINDVAAVLHGEVFRWGFGDSGQCNKNLGSAFLMVFRIGLVKEVIEKLEQATDVVFSTGTTKSSQSSHSGKRRHGRQASGVSSFSAKSSASRAKHGTPSIKGVSTAPSVASHLKRKSQAKQSQAVNPMSLSLQSLPGISTFTDRAVIGMLKSFAGIYRDNKIRTWNNDFRLGQGVGVFTVSMIFGMDAGWAVEGAVGSEYKIDATYLSPHVNMASRMMGACKQYNVVLMLSQAVQELMSDIARTKLRHLDTVTVKGSSVKQKIYTYDARAKGVDFFLYSRPDDQADVDAERYTTQIWNTDQDLKAMRQHVTEDFLEEFNSGRKAYLAGDWSKAMVKLERAHEMMVETALEEGYLEDEFDALQARAGQDAHAAEEELKRENGDGPSLVILNFMKQYGGVAPKGWEGWHPLTRK